MSPSVSEKRPRAWVHLLVVCGLVAVTLAVYGQVRRFKFVNFDDDAHVYQNPHVTGGLTAENIIWAFGIHGPSQWHPLAWLSHQLDCEMFGLWPGGHHLTNLAFHLGCVLLLYLFLIKATGSAWRSAFVAAVFAIHPLNVESVAWVSERRNVLALFFGLLTLLAYGFYAKTGTFSRYLLVVLFFSLALMSKPLVVTLPLVLLLLDYWPLGRMKVGQSLSVTLSPYGSTPVSFSRLLLEKIPLLILAIGASTLTVWCQKGAFASDALLPIRVRLLNALAVYGIYLRKFFWPSDLGVFYPHPGVVAADPVSELLASAILGGTILLLVTAWAIWSIRRHPYFAVGWFWYLGTLLPMIGLVQVGRQQMADRYAYLSLIGILIALAWTVSETASARKLDRSWLRLGGVGAVFVFAVFGWIQTAYWRESVTLFEQTLFVTKQNSWAHNNLGLALMERGRPADAGAQFIEAIRIDPNYGLAHYNLGVVLHDQGRISQAIPQYQQAIRLMPGYAAARMRLGISFANLGDLGQAVFQFQKAVALAPENQNAHLNLGIALSRQAKIRDANHCFRRVLELDPKSAKAHYGLAVGLFRMGKFNEAEQQFTRTIELVPDFAPAHIDFAKLLLEKGNRKNAVFHLKEALRIDPSLPEPQILMQRAFAPEDPSAAELSTR